jgi:hypothetical protein
MVGSILVFLFLFDGVRGGSNIGVEVGNICTCKHEIYFEYVPCGRVEEVELKKGGMGVAK